MAKLFGMCFNWKVLLALFAVGVGIWLVVPSLLLGALPLLLLAACPLSMFVMAWVMKGRMEGSPKPAQVAPQDHLADLQARKVALERESAEVNREIEAGNTGSGVGRG